MSKVLFLLSILFMAACNTNAPGSDKKGDTAALHAWSQEDENEFLAGCVDNAAERLPQDSAYAYCKCVLLQLKGVFPSMDSAASILMDSARAAAYAQKCR